MDASAAPENSAQPKSNKNCLIITAIVVGLAVVACIASVVLMLVVVRSYQGLPPEAFEDLTAPDATVSLSVRLDGCAVERGEVRGTDEVGMLTWVVAGLDGITVLERSAENETRYRYAGAGDYTVTIKAWFEGAYWPISDTVTIACP